MDELFHQIANEVADLVRDPAVLQYFRQMIEKYGRMNKKYRDALQAKEQEIDDNCKAILEDKRLRDRKAGPPSKGWYWVNEVDYEEYVDEKGIFREREIDVRGWFPPSKLHIPPNPWPWEPGCDNELTPEAMLPAEYLLLACCHDHILTSRPAIIDEDFAKKCGDSDLSIYLYQRTSERWFHESLLRPLGEELKHGLKDVLFDLREKDLLSDTYEVDLRELDKEVQKVVEQDVTIDDSALPTVSKPQEVTTINAVEQTKTIDDSEWPTVSESSLVTDINRGTIWRAAKSGELPSNDKEGRERRIHPLGLIKWKLKRIAKGEQTESNARVKALVNQHVKD
ncbi:hypothetical protein ACFL02_00340 [Planctomycetota bacterium]